MASGTGETRVTHAQALFVSWVMDVLVYIVVLGLFVEYVPSVITESFIISIFTAVVLKLLIDAIARLEHHVSDWFKRREGLAWRILGPVTMFSILFFSKFAVLEIIDIIFGDRVALGGFIGVFALVLCMILARLLLTWTYRRLGEQRGALTASWCAPYAPFGVRGGRHRDLFLSARFARFERGYTRSPVATLAMCPSVACSRRGVGRARPGCTRRYGRRTWRFRSRARAS